jgi:translation elongation factor EF-1beta
MFGLGSLSTIGTIAAEKVKGALGLAGGSKDAGGSSAKDVSTDTQPADNAEPLLETAAPLRVAEVTAAIFEVYPAEGVAADAVAQQVRALRFPGHKIEVGEMSVEDIGFGVKALKVAVAIKHETSGRDLGVDDVEVALKNCLVGNHKAVSSVRLLSLSKVVF